MNHDRDAGHDQWEELAAGYALHALEPEDEQRFTVHVPTCPRCSAALDDFQLVAAQLGTLADTEREEPPDWRAMRAAVLRPAESPEEARPGPQRRATRALLLVAASVVALIGVGVGGWRLANSGGHGPGGVGPLAACAQPACHIIRLHDDSGTSPAVVLVRNDRVTLVPGRLRQLARGRMYVLWQLPRDGGPIPILRLRHPAPTSAVGLPVTYADTAAFAISNEPSSRPPVRPTRVLAVGSAT